MTRTSHGRLLAALLATALMAVAWLAATTATASAAKTTWLCQPLLVHNPCAPGLSTTRVSPAGRILGRERVRGARKPKLDCFYVYPTVSDERRPQSDLRVHAEERSIALYQAARYSQLCRVFAPMYRQITIYGLAHPGKLTPAMYARAYGDLVNAWHVYLHDANHGGGIVLIGQSQGAFFLRKLISEQIDPNPAVRRKLVSAILLGGNVLVRQGSNVGGDFQNVPACRSRTQVHCVVAFSTFGDTPPANSIFGRPISMFGVGPQDTTGMEVLCTNPAALGGGSARLDTILPVQPFAPRSTLGIEARKLGYRLPRRRRLHTTWIDANGAYTGQCVSANGANVLQVAPRAGAPTLRPLPDATWGLHLADANIALGNLVSLVRSEAAHFH